MVRVTVHIIAQVSYVAHGPFVPHSMDIGNGMHHLLEVIILWHYDIIMFLFSSSTKHKLFINKTQTHNL